MIKQDNPLKPSNITINNKDKQFFEMKLETNTIIKSLTTLTTYNWQLPDVIDSLTFLAVFYMWNSIRYIDNNSKSSIFHYYLL